MSASDTLEDRLDVTLAMIDTRAWGARLRVVSIIRVLQRRSADGWAYVSATDLAERAGISARYGWDLFGTGRSSPGLMWRVERVLVRGAVGRGTRPTAWRVNPVIEDWRNVPWRVTDRRRRQLELEAVERAPDRGTEEGLVPMPHVAGLGNLAPRCHVAALDPLVPRSMIAGLALASPATSDRGANPADVAPSSSSGVVGAAAPPLSGDDDDEGSFATAIKAAVLSKTGHGIWGRPWLTLKALEGTVTVEELVRLIMAAPSTYNPQQIAYRWIPDVLKHGVPAPPGSRSAAELANERARRRRDGDACPLCNDSGFLELPDGTVTVCTHESEAMSPSRATMGTP